jgi:antitoxin VapB
MAININDPKADNLARELARATGETITQAVTMAMSERLERVRAAHPERRLTEELAEIAARCAALPVLDERSDAEILGYDERGLPG